MLLLCVPNCFSINGVILLIQGKTLIQWRIFLLVGEDETLIKSIFPTLQERLNEYARRNRTKMLFIFFLKKNPTCRVLVISVENLNRVSFSLFTFLCSICFSNSRKMFYDIKKINGLTAQTKIEMGFQCLWLTLRVLTYNLFVFSPSFTY